MSLIRVPPPVICTPLALGINDKGFRKRAILAATSFFRHHGPGSPDAKNHNRQALACTLPEEVLREIFFACTRLTVQEDSSEINAEGSWSWVNVSYVCSSWRRIALECQDLWRCIDFSNPKWHAITSGRAKICPLHIQTTITDRNISLLRRTLHLANRIEDIHLIGPIQHIYSLLALLTCPNPSLKSLIVDVRTPQDRSALYICHPPTLPSGGPPLRDLTYMELHSAPFSLLTPRCTFLTHLHLHDLPLTERPTFQYFLFKLEKLERLQYLTLDRAFPSNDFDVSRRISLPRLKRINLGGSVTEIANLLDSIMIPPSVCIICKVYTFVDLKAGVWKFCQQLSAHSWANTDGQSSLETLVVARNESCSRLTDEFQPNPEFRQSLRFRAFRQDCEGGEAAFDITFDPEDNNNSDDGDDELMITALTATWKGLALSQVHILALQNLDIVTQRTWLEYLRTLPSLRILGITGRPPSGLVWALLMNAKHQVSDTDDEYQGAQVRLLVPKLNDIYLNKVDCSSGGFMVSHTAPINSYFDLDDSRFLDVLVAGLTARSFFGLSLRSLSISRCEYVLHESVENARKAVCHLVCDQRNSSNGKESAVVDEQWPARYWDGWKFENWQPRHFYRLRTVVSEDSEPE